MFKIGILEDSNPLRISVCEYLAGTGLFRILFEASRISALQQKEPLEIPDFILLDIHLKDGTSLKNIQYLKEIFPGARIVVITGDEQESMLRTAIENGVSGYVQKPFRMAELVHVLQTVHNKGTFLSQDLVARLMNSLNKSKPESIELIGLLSERESEVALLLRQGQSYKEVACSLGISFHTVNHHIKNIYLKLKVRNRYELQQKIS